MVYILVPRTELCMIESLSVEEASWDTLRQQRWIPEKEPDDTQWRTR